MPTTNVSRKPSTAKDKTTPLFIRNDIGVALHFERVRDYLDEKLKSVHNKENCETILALFLTLASDKDGAWFSWLHAKEAMSFMASSGLKVSHRSYYRAIENLKKTGILQEVLPYTWKNRKVIQGQCTVFLIDPLLVAFVKGIDTVCTPDDQTEAIELAKVATRRTKQSPNKQMYEVSQHVKGKVLTVEDFLPKSEPREQDQEPEVDTEEVERRSLDCDAEEEAYKEYVESMDRLAEECGGCGSDEDIDDEAYYYNCEVSSDRGWEERIEDCG